MIPRRRFGRTGLDMPVFTCGGMRFQNSWKDEEEIPDASQKNLEETVLKALDCGINHIETARGYGSSEYQLGKILPRLPREKMIVQTKVSPEGGGAKFRESFERSMSLLHLDHVDLLSLHGINNAAVLEESIAPGGALAVAREIHAQWLAQGTIYPDVIESGGAKNKKAVTIKSHHNVGGLPEQLGLKLLEPLRDLFKDEVRELGVALGLPRDMVYRHPFPGPGLGVRILGEVKKEYADLLRRADDIFINELRAHTDPATGKSWYDLTSQAFAVFLPVKSVGVMGDGRTYEYVVALRAVQTSDFMTADWAELPYALLKKVSSRIINEVRGINRVTLDVSSKPPATIEWE